MFISIVMPVHNDREYVGAALKSVLVQCHDECEIIIVDDGSVDGSGEILKSWCRRSKKIKVLSGHDLGPSKARNMALDVLSPQSELTFFIDADDIISKRYFSRFISFFTNNDVNLASAKIRYFGDYRANHGLNYRFKKGSRVVNILTDYQDVQFNLGGIAVRSSILRGDGFRFNEAISFWEDALFINRIILNDENYGLVAGPTYYYRKHQHKASLVEHSWSQKERYIDVPKFGYQHLIGYSKQKFHHVIKYVQYLVLYHMKLIMVNGKGRRAFSKMSKSEYNDFIATYTSIIAEIDGELIDEQHKTVEVNYMLHQWQSRGWPVTAVQPTIPYARGSLVRKSGLHFEIKLKVVGVDVDEVTGRLNGFQQSTRKIDIKPVKIFNTSIRDWGEATIYLNFFELMSLRTITIVDSSGEMSIAPVKQFFSERGK